MNKQKEKQLKRVKRKMRVRAKVEGVSKRPRLSVFRSNRGMYFQIIDDSKGKTLVSVHTREVKGKKTDKKEVAFEAGKLIAKKALAKKIKEIVFDKGNFKYHGRVEAAARGAREGGLKF